MNPSRLSLLSTPRRWLLGLALLCAGLAASAQQQQQPDPIARLNVQQGNVSVSPAGQDRWYAARPDSQLAVGDRLRTERNARAEVYIGSAALRLDGQTQVAFSELDDDTVHLTATRGDLQLRVREAPAGQRLAVDTGNASVVIGAPGDYRIASDPAAGTTWVAVASGQLALYGQNGASQRLGDRQQTTVSGRNLSAVRSTRTQNGSFDTWVAERNRLEESSGYAGARPPLVRVPSAALIAQQQQQIQYEQAQQMQQLQWADQQRAAQAARQQQEWQRDQDWRRQQEWRQQEDWRQQRQQQDWQLQQQQQQQRRGGRERAEQDRWQQQQQQQQMQLQLQQQQAVRRQQEAQAQQQQLQVRQQQEMQLRTLQMQQQVQAQQAAQQNTMRQAQEAQLRAIQQQQQQQQQQRGTAPAQPPGQNPSRLWTSPDSR